MHAAAAFHGNDGSTTWSSGPYSTSVGTGVRSNNRGTSSIGRLPGALLVDAPARAAASRRRAYGSVRNATSSAVNAFGVPQSRWPYMPRDVRLPARRRVELGEQPVGIGRLADEVVGCGASLAHVVGREPAASYTSFERRRHGVEKHLAA